MYVTMSVKDGHHTSHTKVNLWHSTDGHFLSQSIGIFRRTRRETRLMSNNTVFEICPRVIYLIFGETRSFWSAEIQIEDMWEMVDLLYVWNTGKSSSRSNGTW